MWKCSNCGTDNEYNFCTNCQSRKEESGLKPSTPSTPKQGQWKCSRCEAEVDGNFCGQCRMPRTENEVWQFVEEEEAAQQLMSEKSEVHPSVPKGSEAQQPASKESEAQQSASEESEAQQSASEGSEAQQSASEEPEVHPPVSGESEAQQQTPEQGEHQQPPPQQAAHQQPSPQHQTPPEQAVQQQPEVTQKSGKKGVIIAIVVTGVIIALLATVIVLAMRLVLDDGGDTRDSDIYVEEHEVEEDEDDEAQGAMLDTDGPYHLDVWGESNVMQLENNSMTLNVPLPPNTIMEEVELTRSTLSLGQGEGTQWFHVWINLGNRQLEDDFEEYSDAEVGRALRSHGNFGEVLDYHVYKERYVTLLMIHWEDEYGEGISFAKISELEGYLLVTEIGFESLENREDFFEAYGFKDHFESIIQEVVAQWETDGADASNQEEDEGRNGEELWTDEQMDSWSDLRAEFREVSNLSFELFFFVWDYVIIEETILDQYPNADVERLTRLHTEFLDRFDELNDSPAGIDFTLPYNSEHNQDIFQQTRALILEHESFYNDFRAALEGR